MNAVERFRSQLLACGARLADADEGARLYARALATDEDADWSAFYRVVHDSLQRIHEAGQGVDIFARTEIADVLLLLQDDLGARLFTGEDIKTLARDLLDRSEAIVS